MLPIVAGGIVLLAVCGGSAQTIRPSTAFPDSYVVGESTDRQTVRPSTAFPDSYVVEGPQGRRTIRPSTAFPDSDVVEEEGDTD